MKPWQNTLVQNCKFDVSSLLLNLLERLYKILYLSLLFSSIGIVVICLMDIYIILSKQHRMSYSDVCEIVKVKYRFLVKQ